MTAQFDAAWQSHNRKARCKTNPRYPHGVMVDSSGGAAVACTIPLRYPAPECGIHHVRCKICGKTAAITAAGRPDDPVSVRVACEPMSVVNG